MTPIEPATLRLVAQCLNLLRHPGNRDCMKHMSLMAELDTNENPRTQDIRILAKTSLARACSSYLQRRQRVASLHSRIHGIHVYMVLFCVRISQPRHGNSYTHGLAQNCWPTCKLAASVSLPSNKHIPPSLPPCLKHNQHHPSSVISTVVLNYRIKGK
jgi:hypothetical protein